jgi:hypothetical protein
MRPIVILAAVVIGLGAAFRVGYDYGQCVAVHREFERQYDRERELVAPVLAADPAFGRLITVNFPVAGICLGGPVATRDDYNRLRSEVLRLFGEPRVGHVMQDVWVERAAEPGAGRRPAAAELVVREPRHRQMIEPS